MSNTLSVLSGLGDKEHTDEDVNEFICGNLLKLLFEASNLKNLLKIRITHVFSNHDVTVVKLIYAVVRFHRMSEMRLNYILPELYELSSRPF